MQSEDGTTHIPCITDPLAFWEIGASAYEDRPSEVVAATHLLQGFLLSMKLERARSHSSDSANLGHWMFRPLTGLHSMLNWCATVIDNYYCSPSPTLLSYTHLRHNGCPWQVGYFTSFGGALCRVTAKYLEFFPSQSHPDTLDMSADSGDDQLTEKWLIESIRYAGDDNSNLPTASTPKNTNLMTKMTSREILKKTLSYDDPLPQWRFVTFGSQTHDSCVEQNVDLVGIGYSNASVEIINLSSISNDDLTHILISSPYDMSASRSDLSSQFYPIVHLELLDKYHLLVCHFNGSIDFWHLDWEAKRFPARLMVHLGPDHLYSRNHTSNCILSADYDPVSGLLVLCGLPTRRSNVKCNLQDQLALNCFSVSTVHPFLERCKSVDDSSSRHNSSTDGLLFRLTTGKNLLGYWLTRMAETFRYSNQTADVDAIAFLHISPATSTSASPIAAALHCSGTCSVWTLPQLEPLFMVLNSPGCLLNDLASSPPFRLAWWTKRKADGTADVKTARLVVVHENGQLTILNFQDQDVGKLNMDEKQIHELNLSPLASFGRVACHRSSSVQDDDSGLLLLVDHKSPTDVLWSPKLYGQSSDGQHLIRVLRLSSTTTAGLFRHLISKGSYHEAIQFAMQHNLNVEIVHQRKWLDACKNVRSIVCLSSLVDSTLALVRQRPVWVIKQCLSYVPSCSGEETINPSDFFSSMRHLYEHGLLRAKSHLQDENVKSMVENRFYRKIFFLECVEQILSVQSTESVENKHHLLSNLVEFVKMFEYCSVLDICLAYAQAGQFETVRLLMEKFPETVGRHRLAILSNLCETIDPDRFGCDILRMNYQLPHEPHCIQLFESEFGALDRLYGKLTSLPHIGPAAPTLGGYTEQLGSWLIQRVLQVESRTGMVNHALKLLNIGLQVLEELGHLQKSKTLANLLVLQSELSILSEIVYHKPVGESSNVAGCKVTLLSNSRPITLARFGLSHFRAVTLEDRIGLLLQLGSHSDCSSEIVLRRCGLLRTYIGLLYPTIDRQRSFMLHTLLSTATHHGLTPLINLMELINAGTEHDLIGLKTRSCSVHFVDGVVSHELISNSDIVSCLVDVLFKYEPPPVLKTTTTTSENWKTETRQHNLAFAAYLKDVSQIIASVSCFLSDVDDTCQLGNKLRLISQCTTALSELYELAQSLALRLDYPISVGVKSVGELTRCCWIGTHLQRLLAYWIASIGRVVRVHAANMPKKQGTMTGDEAESKLLVKILTEFLEKFLQILHSAFEPFPAANWLSVGLHFSLLTAGDKQLFELSQSLQLRAIPAVSDFQDRLVCLLHSLRVYVNASMPKSHIPTKVFAQKPLEDLEPNERMARECLSLFRQLQSSDKPIEPSLRAQFDLEEQLLNVSAFISSVLEYVPKSQVNLIPVAPFRLRPLWTNLDGDRQSRSTVFSVVLLAMLKSLRHSHSTRRRFIELFKSNSLFHLVGSYFRMDHVQTNQCFLQAVYKHLNSNHQSASNLPPQDLLDHVLSLLITSVSNPTYAIGCWKVCSQWAGCNLDVAKQPSTNQPILSNLVVGHCWTPLHALFRLSKSADSSSLTVELFRLYLVRSVFKSVPINYLSGVHNLLAVCWFRIDSLLTTDSIEAQLKTGWVAPLESLKSDLVGLLRTRLPRHFSANFSQSNNDYNPDECVPYIYLSLLSPSLGGLSNFEVSQSTDCQTILPQERQWFRLSLLRWIKQFVGDWDQTFTRSADIDCSSSELFRFDSRLFLCYEFLVTKFAIENSNLPPTSYILPGSVYHVLSECSSSNQFREPLYIDRLKLVAILYSLVASRTGKPGRLVKSPNCFPNGELLVQALTDIQLPENLPPSVRGSLGHMCEQAVSSCLLCRSTNVLLDLDLNLLNQSEDYRVHVIGRISNTHVILGLRLANLFRCDRKLALFSRLDHLFSDQSDSDDLNKNKHEAGRLLNWLHVLLSNEDLINWCEMNVYPHLRHVEKLKFLIDALISVTNSGDYLLVGFPLRTHRSIIDLLRSDENTTRMVERLSYAKLIQLLCCPLLDEAYRDHPLQRHLRNSSVLSILARVLSELDQIHSSDGFLHTPSLGDLHVMHTLNLAASVLFDSTNLTDLLESVAPIADSRSTDRLVQWITSLLYHTDSVRFTVEQRRLVLSESATYLQRKFIDNTDSESTSYKLSPFDALQRINVFSNQLDRIVNNLKNTPFPSPLRNVGADQYVDEDLGLGDFFTQFLILSPDEVGQSQLLVHSLIDAVHSSSSEDLDKVTAKLHWYGHYLPLCMEALSIGSQKQVEFLVNAICRLLPPPTSVFDRSVQNRLNVDSTIHEYDSLSDSIFGTLQSATESDLIRPDSVYRSIDVAQLLGPILCHRQLRLDYGHALCLRAFDSTKPSTISSIMYEAACFLAFQHPDLIWLSEISPSIRPTEFDPNDFIVAFSNYIGNEASALRKAQQQHHEGDLFRLFEIFQTVSELTLLLFDSSKSRSPNPSVAEPSSLSSSVWNRWFDFGFNAGVFLTADSGAAHFLHNSWTSYGHVPPRDLAVQSLNRLQSNTNDHMNVQTTLVSICLLQSEVDIVRAALDLIRDWSAEWIGHIPPDSCHLFALNHGSLWVECATSLSSLFTHVYHEIDRLAPPHAISVDPTCVGEFLTHCIQYLYEADIWADALHLTRHLFRSRGSTRVQFALGSLVQYVSRLRSKLTNIDS